MPNEHVYYGIEEQQAVFNWPRTKCSLAEAWQLSASFFERATGQPTHLGHALLTEEKQVPVYLVLFKGKSKNRHQANLNKEICTSGKSKKHSKAAKEPWLLVTSLPQARDNPHYIVNMEPL